LEHNLIKIINNVTVCNIMSAENSRVRIETGEPFEAREWLRREVLWASLMTPYDEQLQGWVSTTNTQFSQHQGNASRRDVYGGSENIELLSQAFFQQGKTAAGLLSSVIMFKTFVKLPNPTLDILGLQAESVDSTLELDKSDFVSTEDTENVYRQCARLAVKASRSKLKKGAYLKASRLMLGIAGREAQAWAETSIDNSSGRILTIPNGGHPRSAGNRVDVRQLFFNTVLESDAYRAHAI
jgi:hypothetical protein